MASESSKTVKIGYEPKEALNPHSVGQGKNPSRGLPGIVFGKIRLLWECLKPTKVEFATFAPVLAEKHHGLQGP